MNSLAEPAKTEIIGDLSGALMAKKTKRQLLWTAEVTLKDGTTDTCWVYSIGGTPWLERVGKSGIEKKPVHIGHRSQDEVKIDIAGWYKVPNGSVKFK
jgi:hypothetical protein